MSLHDEDLAEAPSRIQENVWTRHVLPGLAGAEPTPKIMGYSERGDKKIHTCRREGGEDPSCFWKIEVQVKVKVQVTAVNKKAKGQNFENK